MLKYFCVTVFCLGLTITARCQADIKPSKLKELGESAEIEGDPYTAIYYYELLQLKKPGTKAGQKLGLLYMQTRSYEKAKNLFLQAISSSKNQAKNYLNLGLSYKHMGQYDSCIYYLDKCNKNKLTESGKNILKKEYDGAKLALETPLDTATIHLNSSLPHMNTAHMESAPCFINDSLIVFATQEINKDNLYPYNDTLSFPRSKLYYAEKYGDNWVKKEELTEINQQFNHVGNGFFSLDQHYFYFTQTLKNWNKKNISQLYVSEHRKGHFKPGLKLDSKINDPYYSSTQPTVGTTFSSDYEVVYFSSDRPGGKGGMDIWYTVFNKKRGTYGGPINAGYRINTAQDEITPYYDPSTKTLYFSSNGLISFGGFDVFKSVGELKSWTHPTNIGNYLNSHADEIYFRLNPSRNAGFIVSNKPASGNRENAYCCFDLAYFTYKNPNQLHMKGTLLTKINPIIDKILKSGVEFRDSSFLKDKYLSDAIISLYLKTEMGTDSLFITSDTSDAHGFFEFNAGSEQDYSLIIEENNEIKAQVSISTKGMQKTENREIVLDFKPIESLPDAPLVIKNIYYGFGESDLNNAAKKILDETLISLLREIPNISVEVSSHTDNIGDEAYNLKLSEARAEKVTKYLIESGISKNRLITKGYGETVPIAPNEQKDGSDYPEGRERNRRTEFKITGTFKHTLGM